MTNAVITRNKTGKRNQRRRRAPRAAVGPVGRYAEDAWSLAKRTAQGLNAIRRMINTETKFLDVIISGTTDYTGGLTSMSQMAQGLTNITRVGNSIRLHHISLRGVIIDGSTAGTTVRIIIFRDLEATGSNNTATLATLLQTTGTVNAVNSPFNRLYLDRYSILYDETVSTSAAGDFESPISFDSAHQGHVKYLGTAADAASDGQGTVYVAYISNRVTSALPTVNLYTRIMFTDD